MVGPTLACWLVVAAALAAAAACAFKALVYRLVWRPYAVARRLRAQGVRGPGYRFFVGSLGDIRRLCAETAGAELGVHDHDFVAAVHPYFRKWISLYGRTFLYWTGATPNLCLADVSLAKQVLFDRTGMYPKNLMNPHVLRQFGMGLVFTDGDEWKRHRKVVDPAFNMDKLKAMTGTMSDCARSMVSEWEAQLAGNGSDDVEVELSSRFRELAADVLSHTVFGSSYAEGKRAYLAQMELQEIAFSTVFNVQIPGFRYLPTEKNLKTRKLDKLVRTLVTDLINRRRLAAKDTAGYGDDLLGVMLEACCSAPEVVVDGKISPVLLSMDEIIAECKTFVQAGQDGTTHLLTWTAFLLSTHPEWQEKIREEVRRECGRRSETPTTVDVLNKLKLLHMFLLETLRLYAPVSWLERKAGSDLDLGGVIRVPEGTILTIPIAAIHRDEEVWGDDAGEFRPERFENGVARAAKHPNALMTFSVGPRACIGQNFTMIEAKVTVAMILHRFSLQLSPKYVHSPMEVMTMRPRHGLPIILKSVKTM